MNGNRPADPMTKSFFWWIVFPILVILLLMFAFAFYAHAQFEGDEVSPSNPNLHPHPMDWIAKYKGKNNGGCCGHQDCVPVNLHIIEEKGELVDVEIFFKKTQQSYIFKDFPRKAFHVSEDENDYYCFIPFNRSYPTGRSAEQDECAKNPNQECSNCFFFAPKS